jgi:hypothetical protein
MDTGNDIPIAKTVEGVPVVLTPHDRARHVYLVGKTGERRATYRPWHRLRPAMARFHRVTRRPAFAFLTTTSVPPL